MVVLSPTGNLFYFIQSRSCFSPNDSLKMKKKIIYSYEGKWLQTNCMTIWQTNVGEQGCNIWQSKKSVRDSSLFFCWLAIWRKYWLLKATQTDNPEQNHRSLQKSGGWCNMQSAVERFCMFPLFVKWMNGVKTEVYDALHFTRWLGSGRKKKHTSWMSPYQCVV